MALKLFLWRDVLTDYTSGAAFALAETEDEARRLVCAACNWKPELYEQWLESNPEFKAAPEVVTERMGFAVYGGG